VSEYKPITGELRNSMTYDITTAPNGVSVASIDTVEFVNICDSIDSIHANLERENERLRDSDGCIELPKDADGVPIRVGDVMEGVNKYDSLKKVMGKVITVSFESDGIVDVAIQAWDSNGKSWHRAYLDPNASVYRHYHAPTVEDVLREMLDAWGELPSNETNDAIVAKYAKRLTLAGDAE